MVKIPLLLFMLAASILYLFYPGSEQEDESTVCSISDDGASHSCYIRCQRYGDHWSGCCVPLKNVHIHEMQSDIGRCACCQRDYSKNRDFCAPLIRGECPTLYDQSVCFYMEGQTGKRYCDANKTEMQRSIEIDLANRTRNAKARKRRDLDLS